MGVPEIGLADAIKSLRAELSKALTEGEKEAVHFRLGPVELEFVVGITVGGQVGGGVKFWVLSVDAGGSASRSSQHRIKLTLQPIGAEGELEVSSEEGERPE